MPRFKTHILMLLYQIYMLIILWKHRVMVVVSISFYQGLIFFIARPKARRNSGGSSVYVIYGHSKGVKPLKIKHPDNTWTKVDHLHLKLKKGHFTWHLLTSPLSILAADIESVYSQL